MKEGGLCQKGEENDRCDLPLFCAIAVNILRSFLWPSSPSSPSCTSPSSPLYFSANRILFPILRRWQRTTSRWAPISDPLGRYSAIRTPDATQAGNRFAKKKVGGKKENKSKYITHASDWAAYHLRSRAQVSSPLGDPDCDLHFKIRRPAGNASSLSPGKG